MRLATSKILLSVCTALLLVAATTSTATAKTTQVFDATIDGTFVITGGIGDSPLFTVSDSGTGVEAILGAFTFSSSVIQNLARLPEGCFPPSSTGVDGKATLEFAEGTINLKRTSGDACFSFPTVTLSETWVITSGTGIFRGASGMLNREFEGNVIFGTLDGDLSGTISLLD